MSSELGTKEYEAVVACPKCGQEIKYISTLDGCNMEKVIVTGAMKLSDKMVISTLYYYEKNKPLKIKGIGTACFFCGDCYVKYKKGIGNFEGFISMMKTEYSIKLVQRELQ